MITFNSKTNQFTKTLSTKDIYKAIKADEISLLDFNRYIASFNNRSKITLHESNVNEIIAFVNQYDLVVRKFVKTTLSADQSTDLILVLPHYRIEMNIGDSISYNQLDGFVIHKA